jgi:hypothetical protein
MRYRRKIPPVLGKKKPPLFTVVESGGVAD